MSEEQNTTLLPEVPFAPDIRFIQKVVIKHPTDNSRFLLMKRREDDDSRPGDVDVLGGSVALNELHDEALSREVKEEAGLSIFEVRPVLVNTRYLPEEKLYFLLIGYVATTSSDKVVINQAEHSGFEWTMPRDFYVQYPNHLLTPLIMAAFE